MGDCMEILYVGLIIACFLGFGVLYNIYSGIRKNQYKRSYQSIIAWIKKKYGFQFTEPMTSDMVRNILSSLPIEKNKGFQKALQKYIQAEKYGGLVKIRD